MIRVTEGIGPHAGQPIAVAGAGLESAEAAVVMLHGRGGDAADMLGLAKVVAGPLVAILAPSAAGRTWYPYAFTEPTLRNEPYLSSARSVVENLLVRLTLRLPPDRIALLGFSQGACLALESASWHMGPLGAIIGLSGGLIGDRVEASGRPAHAGLDVLLGCSEYDPHIPLTRVRETEAVFRSSGATVSVRIYPGSFHGINADEIEHAGRVIAAMTGDPVSATR